MQFLTTKNEAYTVSLPPFSFLALLWNQDKHSQTDSVRWKICSSILWVSHSPVTLWPPSVAVYVQHRRVKAHQGQSRCFPEFHTYSLSIPPSSLPCLVCMRWNVCFCAYTNYQMPAHLLDLMSTAQIETFWLSINEKKLSPYLSSPLIFSTRKKVETNCFPLLFLISDYLIYFWR